MEPKDGKMKSQNMTMADLLSVSTHEPSFKQGHVGNLQMKDKYELEEMLARQEKLLANRAFVARLPDKGEKVSKFAQSLRERINYLNSVQKETHEFDISDRADSVGKMISGNAETFNNAIKKESSVISQRITNENMEMEDKERDCAKNELVVIEKNLSNLAIHEGPHYDVVKRAAEKTKKSKFSLHIQQAKKKHVCVMDHSPVVDFNSQNETLKESEHSNATSSGNTTTSYLQPNAQVKPKPTLLLSIEECRELHTKQQANIKVQQAKLTAERMMAKYGLGEYSDISTSESFHPEGTLMSDLHEEFVTDEDIDYVAPALESSIDELD